MSNPHHGEDVIDRGDTTIDQEYDWDDTVTEPGYYLAFRRHPREKLGGKNFRKDEKFGYWTSPEVRDVRWIGPC